MAANHERRILSLCQIVAGILFVLSGMFSISYAASCSREVAISRVGHDIPSEFKRVFINHGTVYNWPFTRGHAILSCTVFVVTLVFLFASAWYARGLKAGSSPDR